MKIFLAAGEGHNKVAYPFRRLLLSYHFITTNNLAQLDKLQAVTGIISTTIPQPNRDSDEVLYQGDW